MTEYKIKDIAKISPSKIKLKQIHMPTVVSVSEPDHDAVLRNFKIKPLELPTVKVPKGLKKAFESGEIALQAKKTKSNTKVAAKGKNQSR